VYQWKEMEARKQWVTASPFKFRVRSTRLGTTYFIGC
jgi:hypothetical protein